jgi:hypothetical protein
MAILKRRTKLVSFRLSDEEYERLQGACIAEGARSLSEFARAALQRTVQIQNVTSEVDGPEAFGYGAKELIDTMRELNRQLGQLVVLAQSANGHNGHE